MIVPHEGLGANRLSAPSAFLRKVIVPHEGLGVQHPVGEFPPGLVIVPHEGLGGVRGTGARRRRVVIVPHEGLGVADNDLRRRATTW